MYKAAYLTFISLGFVFLSGCVTYRPRAKAIVTADPLQGYEDVIGPYRKKKVSVTGAIVNVSFMGLGAYGGTLLATNPDGNSSENSQNSIYYAAGGAAVGYLFTRLMFVVSGNHQVKKVAPIEYPKWVAEYDKRKHKDWLYINNAATHTDTSLRVISKSAESRFRAKNIRDLDNYASVFPTSKYLDTVIIDLNPRLSVAGLDTVIHLLPDTIGRGGIFDSKVQYVLRFNTEGEFSTAFAKYKDVKTQQSIEYKYSQLVLTFPFVKDFYSYYSASNYFDDIYNRLYTKFNWQELTGMMEMYPKDISLQKTKKAQTLYFEMACNFADLHKAISKYRDAPYVVKPEDNLGYEDSAKYVFDKLSGYKPVSPVNNLDKIISNVPREFLSLQHKENDDQIDTLFRLATLQWVKTDSAVEVIDTICMKYAMAKFEDKLVGTTIVEGIRDSGVVYRKTGEILKGDIYKRSTVKGVGQMIRLNDGKRSMGYFEEGELNGAGKTIGPEHIQEGKFVSNQLNGIGKTIFLKLRFTDSGIYVKDQLSNGGQRLYKNGDVYKGNFYNNKFDGHGSFRWADSTKWFDGEFKNGKREGPGILRFANGLEIAGNWKNDRLDGEVKIQKKEATSEIDEKYVTKLTWIFDKGELKERKPGVGVVTVKETDITASLPGL